MILILLANACETAVFASTSLASDQQDSVGATELSFSVGECHAMAVAPGKGVVKCYNCAVLKLMQSAHCVRSKKYGAFAVRMLGIVSLA